MVAGRSRGVEENYWRGEVRQCSNNGAHLQTDTRFDDTRPLSDSPARNVNPQTPAAETFVQSRGDGAGFSGGSRNVTSDWLVCRILGRRPHYIVAPTATSCLHTSIQLVTWPFF